MIFIDGLWYNIPVISLTRSADFLDKYAERTEDGVLHRELIGVYFNYKLELGSMKDQATYQQLWAKLTEPVEFHTVWVPDESVGNSGFNYVFVAYFAGVGDKLKRNKGGINYWTGLTVNFVAKEPART